MPDAPSADSAAPASRTAAIAVALAGGLALAAAAPANAQPQSFRNVLPDGRVVYSDLPPQAVAAQGRPGGGGPAAAPDASALPYALRTAVARHPVLLFTASDCAPCADARVHLNKRGIPFTERTVRTPDDVAAFKKQGFGDTSFPAVAVGTQRMVGYQASGLDQLLDVAGYPKTSVLPPTWQAPAIRPLADAGRAAEAAPAPPAAPMVATPAESGPALLPPPSAASSGASVGTGAFRF